MTLDRRRAETLASALDLDVDAIGICQSRGPSCGASRSSCRSARTHH
jgi:hypothetical protein